jgi:UDP-sulfoquinovose synthase
MTKTMDALMFSYYNKTFGIKITDLHQGIVWGTQIEETKLDNRLINRFDYEGDYGTVLNRFVMQAAIGHPLTVHGTGGQTRAFININDTVKCLKIAVDNPPEIGERVKIFNQTTEQLNILELAKLISKMTKSEIRYYKNPRKEDPENNLKMKCDNFKNLGLNPITLNEGLLSEIYDIAYKYKDNCDKNKIICESVWTADMEIDHIGSKNPV